MTGKNRKITTDQERLLPPLEKHPTSSKYDITLLTCLLRNICGLSPVGDQVWIKPLPTDHSIEADITRLKKYRNEMMHRNNMYISEGELKGKWQELVQILNRLNITAGIGDLSKWISEAEEQTLQGKHNLPNQEVLQPSQEDAAKAVSVAHQRAVPPMYPSLGSTNQLDLTDKEIEAVIEAVKNGPLTDHVMEETRKVLKRQFPEINGLRDARNHFLYEPPVAVQHIFSDKHWPSCYFPEEKPVVYLADSQLDEDWGKDLQKQLIFAHIQSFKGSEIKVVPLKVQQQTNNIDCGVYTIAFEVHVLFQYMKTGNAREAVESLEKVRFDVRQMRPHLLKCLSQEQFCQICQRPSILTKQGPV